MFVRVFLGCWGVSLLGLGLGLGLLGLGLLGLGVRGLGLRVRD